MQLHKLARLDRSPKRKRRIQRSRKQMPAAMPTAMAITTVAESMSLDECTAPNVSAKRLNPF